MTKEDFFLLGEKYAQGKCTKAEALQYEQILIRFENDRDLWLNEEEADTALIKAEILKGIRQSQKQPSLPVARLISIAASIIIVLGVGFYFLKDFKTISPQQASIDHFIQRTAEKGQKLTLTLPDGSVAKLNGESTISYLIGFNDTVRLVHLKGEAFFDVKADASKPFIINTGDIRTTVLGTSFNVNAYAEKEIAVTVVSGIVSVQINERAQQNQNQFSHITLLPGFQGIYKNEDKEFMVDSVDINYHVDWQNGILSFKNASETEVIGKLERWFGASFAIKGARGGNWNLNARYNNKSLEFILNSLSYSLGFWYELNDNKVIINYNDQN